MHIPSKWKSEIKNCTFSNGMSSAEVLQCDYNGKCVYIKSIDTLYDTTTYSVKREKDVMQWLDGKLAVPKVIDYISENNREYMLMSACAGTHIDKLKLDPERYVEHLANCINLLQSIDISNCPHDSTIDIRLKELDYLLQNGLVSVDDWDSTTTFADATELYQWLRANKPSQEELVFSHGDLTANFFVNGSGYCFYDLGRAGIADKWMDIAFCVSDIRDWCGDRRYEAMFFELIGVRPNYEKMKYFLLLDEMF